VIKLTGPTWFNAITILALIALILWAAACVWFIVEHGRMFVGGGEVFNWVFGL